MKRQVLLKVLCISVMLQPAAFPLLISGKGEAVPVPEYLLWAYPLFALLAGYCAWKCIGARTELAVIIIVIAWMSFAGLCYMLGVF